MYFTLVEPKIVVMLTSLIDHDQLQINELSKVRFVFKMVILCFNY